MKHASLFSGFGGAELAALLAGWDNAFWCEKNDFCQRILKYYFPKSKGYEDIKDTDFTEWRGKIDIISGGFPCQPFSIAGKRKGKTDDRYLWPEMLRAIQEIQPRWVIGENVDGIINMAQPVCEFDVESQASFFEKVDKETILESQGVAEQICQDFEHAGYFVQPVILPACSIDAPHRRYRTWFVAYFNGNDVRRREHEKTGRKESEGKISQKEWERIWENFKRVSIERTIAYSDSQRQPNRYKINSWREISSIEKWVQDNREINRLRNIRNASYTKWGRWIQDNESKSSGKFEQNISYWWEFPTQSPICSRDDGFSNRLDNITFPSWRSKSIEGFGNAIVPQMLFEFYDLINILEKL